MRGAATRALSFTIAAALPLGLELFASFNRSSSWARVVRHPLTLLILLPLTLMLAERVFRRLRLN